MNAKTLLRGFSEIDPKYLDAALQAGADAARDPETGAVTDALPDADFLPAVTVHRRGENRLRIAGWAAAAACLLLAGGAMLHLRQAAKENVLVPPASQEDQFVEITGTAASAPTQQAAQSVTTRTTASGRAVSTAGTLPHEPENSSPPITQITQITQTAVPDDTPPAQTVLTQATVLTEQPGSAPAVTSLTEGNTATAPIQPGAVSAVQIPVLVAMADRQGTLPDGSMQFETVTDVQAVRHYLSGDDPAVTVGEGQKDDSTAAYIMQSPAMLRVCWQTDDNRWEEYGIQRAVLDAGGVLHLDICMYSGGGRTGSEPWIYETALLFAGGSAPQIRDVQLGLQYFEEQDGIAQWLAFNAALEDDVQVRFAQ